jgi:plasmid stabilization system protein ParE
VPVDLAGLRAFVVSAFPHYMVFYLPVDKAVDVIRVLQGARDLARLLEEG